MAYSKKVQRALDQVTRLFQERISENYVYHSLRHSTEVMGHVNEIGQHIGLSLHELELSTIAAIFHDSGHIAGHAGHEEEGARLVQQYMQNIYPADDIELVTGAILSTKYPQSPENSVSAALCDADLMYLSLPNFFDKAHLLWEEWILTGQSVMPLIKFYERSLTFMAEHRFHTRYGQDVLEKGKAKNMLCLKNKIQEGAHS